MKRRQLAIEKGVINGMGKKMLVNIGEQRKHWIESVVQAASQLGTKTSEAEVLRTVIDVVAVQDPETFVTQMQKIQLRARLTDLETRKRMIQEEEEALTRQLEQKGLKAAANG